MELGFILFVVGIALLIVSFAAIQVIWLRMSDKLRALWKEVRFPLGDLQHLPLIAGIILTAIAYWITASSV